MTCTHITFKSLVVNVLHSLSLEDHAPQSYVSTNPDENIVSEQVFTIFGSCPILHLQTRFPQNSNPNGLSQHLRPAWGH